MSDNTAILKGFTEEYIAYPINGSPDSIFVLVKPETEFDSVFKCWNSDIQDFIVLHGYNFIFERPQED